jgi:multidrug efflux pump subunit AcrA (membrane-fusion protein)
VTISEFQGKIFQGKVARFAKALNHTARTLLTEVHIDNPSGELYVGLYANVKFLLKPNEPYFLIPTSAVLIRDQGPQVAVVDENGVVQIKSVVLGLDHGKMMEILSGIKENDKIITILSCKIVQGAKVEILEKKQ